MPARNEHLVVILLEPVPKNWQFEIWPPHITVVPWFPVDDSGRLDMTLSAVAKKHQKFSVSTGKTEIWGEKDKFEVVLIDDPGELHRLHWDVFHALEKNGFPIHQKDFLGEKYKPHITLRNRLQTKPEFKPGQLAEVSKIALIQQLRLKKTGTMIKALVKEYELA